MPTEKAAPLDTPASAQKRTGEPPFATLEWWKPQAAVLQSLYGEALALTEARLRKQADLLHDLAAARDFPDALKVQSGFVQEFWADSASQAARAFSSFRKARGAEA